MLGIKIKYASTRVKHQTLSYRNVFSFLRSISNLRMSLKSVWHTACNRIRVKLEKFALELLMYCLTSEQVLIRKSSHLYFNDGLFSINIIVLNRYLRPMTPA
jgi:hypothetical protein